VTTVIGATVSGSKRDDVFALMAEMGRYHPSEPHWYLPLIGVDPSYHRRGMGTGLMRRGLERCNREGMPAYLEASSNASRRLYERFGFQVLGTIQAAASPPLYPMVRQPRPPSG